MRKSVRSSAIRGSLVLGAIVVVILVGIWVRHDSGTHRPPGVPTAFAGLWTGAVSRSNPAGSTTVSIILTAHSSTGGISYGDDLCSGSLRETTTGSATTINFTQRLTYNPGHICTAKGTITLSRPNAATVDFSQTGPAPATGILHRQ